MGPIQTNTEVCALPVDHSQRFPSSESCLIISYVCPLPAAELLQKVITKEIKSYFLKIIQGICILILTPAFGLDRIVVSTSHCGCDNLGSIPSRDNEGFHFSLHSPMYVF